MQHCLGDCCGGPVEPVDGSWHVEWVSGGALHSEMPVFFNGRYREADVEEVRLGGPRPPPRLGSGAACSSSAHADLSLGGAGGEGEAAPSEPTGAGPAHAPSTAALEGPAVADYTCLLYTSPSPRD